MLHNYLFLNERIFWTAPSFNIPSDIKKDRRGFPKLPGGLCLGINLYRFVGGNISGKVSINSSLAVRNISYCSWFSPGLNPFTF